MREQEKESLGGGEGQHIQVKALSRYQDRTPGSTLLSGSHTVCRLKKGRTVVGD